MKYKLMLSLVVLMVAFSVLAVSAQDVATDDSVVSQSVSDDNAVYQATENSGKDVWIDQTVDNSMVYINGELTIVDSSGSTLLVVPLSNSTSSKFSTVVSDAKSLETQTVDNAIDYAKKVLNIKSVKIIRGVSTNTTKVYDNRKYETIEEGDAQLIGDADYLNGAYGLNDPNTVTHLATGDYGRILNLTLSYVAEAVDYVATEDAPVVNDTTADNTTNTTSNTTSNATSNTNVTNVNSNDNVTNNTHIKPKDVAKATGIPFAVLLVSLLGIGVSIRRRK